MTVTSLRFRRSRARFYGEVVGRVSGFHSLTDSGRICVSLRSPSGGSAVPIRADRTQFFWRRRVPLGGYIVTCHLSVGGISNSVYAGLVDVRPGINELSIRLSGGSLRGHVSERTRYRPTTLDLSSVSQHTVRHQGALDAYGRFLFTSVEPGRYDLVGYVPEVGDVIRNDVRISAGVETNLGELEVIRRPHLVFVLRKTDGRPICGRVCCSLWPQDGSQGIRSISFRLRRGDNGRFATKNVYHGLYRYQFESNHGIAEGTVDLSGGEQEQAVEF